MGSCLENPAVEGLKVLEPVLYVFHALVHLILINPLLIEEKLKEDREVALVIARKW